MKQYITFEQISKYLEYVEHDNGNYSCDFGKQLDLY